MALNTETPRAGYRRSEFCDALGISMATFVRWQRADLVQTVKVGGSVFVPSEEVRRLMSEGSPSTSAAHAVSA